MEAYLQSDTGSEQEGSLLNDLRRVGVEIAPHVGDEAERNVLMNGQHKVLTPQARARGFGDRA